MIHLVGPGGEVMTVYLSKSDGLVVLRARAEDDGAIGDLVIELHPGERGLGRSYQEWMALAEGAYEVTST